MSAAQHYAASLGINRFNFMVSLGVGAEERAVPQPVELSVRFHFPILPQAFHDDEAGFLCYGEICGAIADYVQGREFKLVEYLTMQLYALLRARVEAPVKISLKLVKIMPPVEGMLGGATVSYSDLPAGALIAEEL